jgi:hypothetical protein
MKERNPYNPPLTISQPLGSKGNIIRRAGRAALLGTIGYGAYAVSTFFASIAHDANWRWGAGTMIFAFATSELFAVRELSHSKALLRRLIVSCSITIASVVIGGSLCTLAGIGVLRSRTPLMMLRWAGMVLFVFIVLTLIFRRWLVSAKAKSL